MSLFVTVNNEMDRTVKIFDEFYATDLVIPANFRIAQEAGIEPVELLELLQQNTNNKISLNKVFCYYLNTFKSKSSLYGVAVVPKPLEPVARNVVL